MQMLHQDPAAKKGIFENTIFQDVINAMWFGRGDCYRPDFFSKDQEMPLTTIALVAAAVRSPLLLALHH